jgi:enamine deaminase RidA (YjgF/YER057c/UK114 family)
VVEELLANLGIQLPAPAQPVASYIPVRISGEHAFVSGQIPIEEGKVLSSGKLGEDVSIEQGHEAARRCALQALAALRQELGSLDHVKGIVRVDVFVASAPGFGDQAKVANGASDLLVEIFGDGGKHARAAIGVAELPLGASVEVALIARVS